MDAIVERKQKIEELKRKMTELVSKGKPDDNAKPTVQSIRFRNYIPKDENLKEKMENVSTDEKPLDYEEDLKASAAMPGRNDEINITPRKPDWDLKRGVEHKMELLEKRTQKAMLKILKEKIDAEEEEEEEEEEDDHSE